MSKARMVPPFARAAVFDEAGYFNSARYPFAVFDGRDMLFVCRSIQVANGLSLSRGGHGWRIEKIRSW